jgi:hypothetical protein
MKVKFPLDDFGLPVLNEPAIGTLRQLGKLTLALSVLLCLVDARARFVPPSHARIVERMRMAA